MKRGALAAGALCIALVASGCGVPDQAQPVAIESARLAPYPPALPAPTSPSASRLVVFFISSDNTHLVAVSHSDPNFGLSAAIDQLLGGPSNSELSAGVSTAIPGKTKLDASGIQGSVANLDFSKALASVSGQEQLLAFAQIVATATAVPGVQRVRITIARQAVNAPLADGTLAEGTVTRADYASLLP